MISKDLSSFDVLEVKEFLNSFDTVLCDCDGVLWNLFNPIEGVKDTLRTLRECEKKIHFVSNNSSLGTKGILAELKKYNSNIQINDVITPIQAVIAYLKKVKFNKKIYILGTLSMKKAFEDAGFSLADTNHAESTDSLKAIRGYIDDDESIGAVVCDYDVYLTNIKLVRCSVFLRRPDVLFITTAMDKIVHAGNNIRIPGPYFYQIALMEVSGRTPLMFGKPSQNIHNYITDSFTIKDPSRVLFVGDSIETDIKFASTCSYQTLLVFTGTSEFSHIQEIKNENEMPNYSLNSFGDLGNIIRKKLEI